MRARQSLSDPRVIEPSTHRHSGGLLIFSAVMLSIWGIGCGSDNRGSDCHTLSYDPSGLWVGTLPCDPETAACPPGQQPLMATHKIEFNECNLVLTSFELS